MIHQADTIVEILCRRIETDGARPALAVKQAGEFRWLTWNDLAADIAQTTAVLVELGVAAGRPRRSACRRIATSGSSPTWRSRWPGRFTCPIHAPLTGPQIAWQSAA